MNDGYISSTSSTTSRVRRHPTTTTTGPVAGATRAFRVEDRYLSTTEEEDERDQSFVERQRQRQRRLDPTQRWSISSASSTNSTGYTAGLPSYSARRYDDETTSIVGSRRRNGRRWETDDELFKPNHRLSMPAQSMNAQNGYTEETTAKSLLYLLNKERAKRTEIEKAYEQTAKELHELQQTHNEDLSALEGDIQTLQGALVKEAKVTAQLRQLLRDAHSRFADEMQTWSNKVVEMEDQGKELQKTFVETMERLEKEEDELMRLRTENQSLKDQLAGRTVASSTLGRRSLEDVTKVGSMEDRDDVSVSNEPKHTADGNEISDADSFAANCLLSGLKDRIADLERELAAAKDEHEREMRAVREEHKEKLDATIDEHQAVIKQMEEKNEKQTKLHRASIVQQQKTIEDLEQALRMTKFAQNRDREREEKLQKELQEKTQQLHEQQQDREPVSSLKDERRRERSTAQLRRVSISENLYSHARKSSLTSTNSGSGSIEIGSQEGSSGLGDKDEMHGMLEYGEGDQSEMFSEEEEEEERDDQSSSFCTGSENWTQQSGRGSDEAVSLAPAAGEGFARLMVNGRPYSTHHPHHQRDGSTSGNEEVVNDDDMLDAILSDREDRSLPLIGHYSAAEYTEDEDFVPPNLEHLLKDGSSASRRQNFTGSSRFNGARQHRVQSLSRTISQMAGKREWMSGGEEIA